MRISDWSSDVCSSDLWIQAQQADYPVSALCRALGVSRSGFHAWQRRVPSARQQADTRLAMVIQAAHMEHRQAYGTRRLWRVLVERGESCGRHRVARLRRRHGVRSEEHTSELQSLMRIAYAVFGLKKKKHVD